MDITERVEQANENFIKQRETYYQEMRVITEEYTKKVIIPFCERYNLTYDFSDHPFATEKGFWYNDGAKNYYVYKKEYTLERYPKIFSGFSDSFWEELHQIYDMTYSECPDRGSDTIFENFCSSVSK
jgi:hypothetical protein